MSLILFIQILLTISFTPPMPSTASENACVNAEEKKLFQIINDYRKKKKLAPIPFSARLTLVAQTHARDLADNYNFDPQGSCNPHSWSKKGKWSSCCYTNDHKQAECMWSKPKEIAGYASNGYEIAYYSSAGANAAEGLSGWQKSPSHNPLLVNSGIWKQVTWGGIGIGVYKEYAVVWLGVLNDPSTLKLCED